MRNGLYVLFCIVIPAIAIADADCSKKEGFSDVEYLLICDNGRDNISSLKDRVHEEFDPVTRREPEMLADDLRDRCLPLTGDRGFHMFSITLWKM